VSGRLVRGRRSLPWLRRLLLASGATRRACPVAAAEEPTDLTSLHLSARLRSAVRTYVGRSNGRVPETSPKVTPVVVKKGTKVRRVNFQSWPNLASSS
jgi:hypothetical protein